MPTLFGKLDSLGSVDVMAGHHAHHLSLYFLVVGLRLVVSDFTQFVHMNLVRTKLHISY